MKLNKMRLEGETQTEDTGVFGRGNSKLEESGSSKRPICDGSGMSVCYLSRRVLSKPQHNTSLWHCKNLQLSPPQMIGEG